MNVRLATDDDAAVLQEWLSDPATAHCFPCGEPEEIVESAKRWIGMHKEKAALVAEEGAQVVAIAVLYLQTEVQLVHQALHIVVVDPKRRREGIGRRFMEHVMRHAKQELGLELLHAEATSDTEGIPFFRSLGFEIFAEQEGWIKEGDTYYGRVLLEKLL